MPKLIIPAIITAGATTAGMAILQSKSEKKAEERQKKQIEAQQEAQAKQLQFETLAGEHWEELTLKQMEMQSQTHQIQTLAQLIGEEGKPAAPQVLTLPPAKTYTPLEEFNRAIDRLLKVA